MLRPVLFEPGHRGPRWQSGVLHMQRGCTQTRCSWGWICPQKRAWCSASRTAARFRTRRRWLASIEPSRPEQAAAGSHTGSRGRCYRAGSSRNGQHHCFRRDGQRGCFRRAAEATARCTRLCRRHRRDGDGDGDGAVLIAARDHGFEPGSNSSSSSSEEEGSNPNERFELVLLLNQGQPAAPFRPRCLRFGGHSSTLPSPRPAAVCGPRGSQTRGRYSIASCRHWTFVRKAVDSRATLWPGSF